MLSKLTAILILFALWLVNTIFRFIKIESAWALGECLGSLCYYIMSDRRAVIEKNLTIVYQATGRNRPKKQLVKEVFQRNCANLTCSLKTYNMTPEQLSKHITIQASEKCLHAIENNSGAIFCLSHMGNWEILTKIAHLIAPTKANFGAVYRPLDNPTADNYVAQQREMQGCKMFSKKVGLATLSSFIREGGILGILADQRAGKASKNNRPFFGVDSARSKLPAVLHLRTGAPLFIVSVSSTKEAQWTIEISELPEADDPKSRESVLETITQGYEKAFAHNLLDVFWMHTYWKAT